ncbi:MAG: ABC transporter ATP-binding protein, partial [Selenomonas sp.]|nr:ABC transporter ATP-binding protein [Selenomonas sp.]
MNLVVNIEKRLRDFTLCANLTLTDTTLALLGASGSGKSMTLKCIAGLETPDRGQIILNGRTLYDSSAGVNLPPQERSVGYLFQNYALFPNMTVRENVIFALDGSREEKERILAENVARFSLEGLEDARPSALSGGQQQRVAFARILARGADVLLLDEPLGALDLKLRQDMQYELIRLKKELGITFVYVTHDQEEALTMSDT